jgi:hypothetical protein
MLPGAMAMTVGRAVWDAYPITPATRWDDLSVPIRTHARKERLEAAGIHFDWFVYLSERPVVRQRTFDPILCGVIRTGVGDGIWCELGRWDH